MPDLLTEVTHMAAHGQVLEDTVVKCFKYDDTIFLDQKYMKVGIAPNIDPHRYMLPMPHDPVEPPLNFMLFQNTYTKSMPGDPGDLRT